MHLPGAGFCIHCGARLEASHLFCWSCGAERWHAEDDKARDERLPPVPGTPAFQPAPRPDAAGVSRAIPWLIVLYAAGAIYFMVATVQMAAYLLAPTGRQLLFDMMAKQQVPRSLWPALLGVETFIFVLAAAMHALAFYGLRARRRWGWVAATLVAGAWSLLLVGIPALYLLLRRSTRRAFGLA